MNECPTDVLYEIIKYNSTQNFINLCLSDKEYYKFYYNDVIWSNLCVRDFIEMIDIRDNTYLDLYKLCFGLVNFKKLLNSKRYSSIKDLYLTNSIDYIGKRLQVIPNIIGFPNLYGLNFCQNKIKYIPFEVCNLTNLKVLNLEDNLILIMNPEITRLINLESLDLSKNQIGKIPTEIFELTNLKTLNLSHTQIKMIPKDMCKLINLNNLDLSNNLIKNKDLNIYNLTNLISINFKNNQISTIISDIKKLTNLEYINFSNNKLNIVPIHLISLTKLKFVDLSNNNFKSAFIPNNMKHINIDAKKYR